MAVQPACDAPFEKVSDFGVAIRQFGPGQYHCGILYTLGREARLCHFAFHHDLRDEIAKEPYLWADAGLDPVNRRLVAAWVGNLRINNDNIPYGLDSAGCCFDVATGEFLSPPIGKGLTCSTFIMSVLRSLGFNVLKESEWPKRSDDVAFGQRIAEMLMKAHANDDHIQAVKEDIGAHRFRPEEVVGAITLSDWPIAFTDARAIADAIIIDVTEARSAAS
jgi:hypothetical protein